MARLKQRLTEEAKYDYFVITDADVRVEADYLRSVAGIFENPKLGAATCLYASQANSFLEKVQSISMISDFFAGIIVAWQLDGVKFTLGQSILTTRRNVSGFGGYRAIGDRPADDLYIGRYASEQGLDTELLPYVVQTVPDFDSLNQLLRKRLGWRVMRHMRPNGHFGLLFTFGLPWALAAIAVHPTMAAVVGYLGTYLLLRVMMTWLIGIHGMKQKQLWSKMALIPLWDLMAFGIWVTSFFANNDPVARHRLSFAQWKVDAAGCRCGRRGLSQKNTALASFVAHGRCCFSEIFKSYRAAGMGRAHLSRALAMRLIASSSDTERATEVSRISMLRERSSIFFSRNDKGFDI